MEASTSPVPEGVILPPSLGAARPDDQPATEGSVTRHDR